MLHTVGIFLFDEVEILDFAGPFEVFSTATRMQWRIQPQSPPLFEVFTIAQSNHRVTARAGLQIVPQFTTVNHPKIDVLIVPGGEVTAELSKPEIIEWISRTDRTTQLTASVCTGAFLLGKAGLLAGRPITTHWEDIADLQTAVPEADVQTNQRWVDDGKIVTSAGISAGIDMCLYLVARLAGMELAVKTATQMEFDWQRP